MILASHDAGSHTVQRQTRPTNNGRRGRRAALTVAGPSLREQTLSLDCLSRCPPSSLLLAQRPRALPPPARPPARTLTALLASWYTDGDECGRDLPAFRVRVDLEELVRLVVRTSKCVRQGVWRGGGGAGGGGSRVKRDRMCEHCEEAGRRDTKGICYCLRETIS